MVYLDSEYQIKFIINHKNKLFDSRFFLYRFKRAVISFFILLRDNIKFQMTQRFTFEKNYS